MIFYLELFIVNLFYSFFILKLIATHTLLSLLILNRYEYYYIWFIKWLSISFFRIDSFKMKRILFFFLQFIKITLNRIINLCLEIKIFPFWNKMQIFLILIWFQTKIIWQNVLLHCHEDDSYVIYFDVKIQIISNK